MIRRVLFALVLAVLTCTSGAADRRVSEAAAIKLLQRMAQAPLVVSFHGVYVQQYGESLETIHICHVVDRGVIRERRDSLDGPVREMVRQGDQTSLFMQGGEAFGMQTGGRLFPALLPDNPVEILENYTLLRVGRERVAGLETDVYDLAPRDQWRFPHRLWAHTGTGLLLKASTTGYKPEPYDLFAFSQVQVGGRIDHEQLKPVHPVKPLNVAGSDAAFVAPAWARWDVSALPKGFKLIKQAVLSLPRRSQPILHHIFSDGLATVSVFAELGRHSGEGGSGRQGALNIHFRQSGDVRVTTVGEVPVQTLELFAKAYNK